MIWIGTSAALLVISVSLIAWMRWVAAPRLEQQLAVATGGKFVAPVRIPASGRYELWIYFSRKGMPLEKLFALVGAPAGLRVGLDGGRVVRAEENRNAGGVGDPSGLAIPLRWSLQQATSSKVIAYGENNTVGSNAGSADEFGRLLQKLELNAGRYTFTGELPHAVPEFEGVRVRLVLQHEPK